MNCQGLSEYIIHIFIYLFLILQPFVINNPLSFMVIPAIAHIAVKLMLAIETIHTLALRFFCSTLATKTLLRQPYTTEFAMSKDSCSVTIAALTFVKISSSSTYHNHSPKKETGPMTTHQALYYR